MARSAVGTTVAEPARSAKGERTRERIHACAVELFGLRGYERTTMRMVAERAGVNVALSYRYFPSKEHLVLEFYREFTRDFVARCGQVVASADRGWASAAATISGEGVSPAAMAAASGSPAGRAAATAAAERGR